MTLSSLDALAEAWIHTQEQTPNQRLRNTLIRVSTLYLII
jgi:hypothetical protein